MATNNTPNEEVDLGQLFKVIGNGFRNLFNGIGNLFKLGFHYLILVLVFIKTNLIYLGIATLVGGIIGYVLDINSDSYYSSTMVIKTNYGSANILKQHKPYISSLVKNEDSVALAKYFNIKPTEATNLLGFEFEPYNKENNVLKEFDYYITRRDTNYLKEFTLSDFKKRLNDNDLRFQKITFYALNDSILPKLSNGIIHGMKNDYYKNIQQKSIEKLRLKRKRLENDLFEIDSLRKNYRKVALLSVSNEPGSNNVSMSTENSNSRFNKDLDLFTLSQDILFELENLKQDEERSGEIATIISDFNIGKEYNPIQFRKWFRYSIFGFALMVLFILGKRFNSYLDTYNKD